MGKADVYQGGGVESGGAALRARPTGGQPIVSQPAPAQATAGAAQASAPPAPDEQGPASAPPKPKEEKKDDAFGQNGNGKASETADNKQHGTKDSDSNKDEKPEPKDSAQPSPQVNADDPAEPSGIAKESAHDQERPATAP